MSSAILTLRKMALFALLAVTLVAGAWITDKTTKKHDSWVLEKLSADCAGEDRFRDIQVQVEAGLVSLRGSVKLLEDKRQALKNVHSLDHVRMVKSHIVVNTRRVPDGFLRKQLDRKLQAHQLNQILIRVKRGVVTVRGVVLTKADHEHVLSLISTTEGVRDIADRMTVLG